MDDATSVAAGDPSEATPTATVRRGVTASDDRKRDAAQLRRPRLRSGTSALRRLRPSVSQGCGDGADSGLTHYLVLASWKPAASHSRPSIRFSKPEGHSVGRRDADYRNAYELALLRSAAVYLPNFLDGFDRLVAFDAETTGKRTPDAEFIRKQPFAWRATGIIIEVGFVEMPGEGGLAWAGARARRGAPGSTRMGQLTPMPSRSTAFGEARAGRRW
jgi:hypothetical protein